MTLNHGSFHWEEFLGRPDRGDSLQLTTDLHRDQVVLVTGGAGSIGSALADALAAAGLRQFIVLDSSEHNLFRIQTLLEAVSAPYVAVLGSVCDGRLLQEVFEQHRPTMVYHVAAFKHVPLMEANPFAAIGNNALGTHTLAQAANCYGAQMLTISTDKAVYPRSMMGASKRIAELITLAMSTPSTPMSVIRLGNVLGSEGSVVPTFVSQISRGGPVTITDPEASRYFLTMADTVRSILAAAGRHDGGKIFLPDLGEPVKIVELARFVIDALGRSEIPIAYTGLRPGDKLTEELMAESESLETAEAGELRAISSPSPSREQLSTLIEELQVAVGSNRLPELLRVVQRVVPEYRPSAFLQQRAAESVLR